MTTKQTCSICGRELPQGQDPQDHHCGDAIGAPVRVIEIVNPFRPVTHRKEHALQLDSPRPLREVLALLDKNPDGFEADEIISLGTGEILPPEDYAMTLVKPGDSLILAPKVAGGNLWRTIATIAVLAAAIAIPFVLPALGLVASTSTALLTAISAAVAIGGQLLISMFIAPTLSGTKDTGSTYDPSGPKSLARPGTVIPKAYGVFMWGGNIISSFVDQEGSDDYLNALVCYGFGPAASIGEIQLNGKDVSAYQNVTYQTRLGTNNQGVIPGFNKIVNGFPQEIRLLNASGYTVVPGTGTNIQALEVTVKFINGLLRYDDSGNPKELSVSYQVQYSPHGAGTWKNIISPRTTADVVTHLGGGGISYPAWVVLPTDQFQSSGIVYATDNGPHTPGDLYSATQSVTFYDPSGNPTSGSLFLQGEWQPTNPNLNQQTVTDWWGGYRVVSAMQTDPFYDTVKIYGLTAGQYDVRVLKYGAAPHGHTIPEGDITDPHYSQDIWLWNINEIFFEDFAYPNMILVAVRALATNQLSGVNLNILATVTHDIGVTLPSQLAGFEHDNPAIVAYDLVMNPLYGAGQLTGYTIDIPSWVAWASFNDQLIPDLNGANIRRHVFAGVFDTSADVWTSLQKIATMSRAMILPIGTVLSVILDTPVSTPVQLFTVGNIKKDSFKETWMAIDDRATTIEVEFADALRNYRTDLPVSVIPPGGIQPGIVAKTTRVNLFGCTDRSRAWNWAYHKLLENQNLLRSGEIQCAIEACACQAGSVVGVQHDVTQWGIGGRILPGSALRVQAFGGSSTNKYVVAGIGAGSNGVRYILQCYCKNQGAAPIQITDNYGTFVTIQPGQTVILASSPIGNGATFIQIGLITQNLGDVLDALIWNPSIALASDNINLLSATQSLWGGFFVGGPTGNVSQIVYVDRPDALQPTLRIQASGGSATLKAWQSGIAPGQNGVQYYTRITVKNQGAAAISVSDNYGAPLVIPPGTTATYTSAPIGNGVTNVQFDLSTNASGDVMDVVVSAAFIGLSLTGANLMPPSSLMGSAVGFNSGVVLTLTAGWTLCVLHPTLLRGKTTIASPPAGNTITLTAAPTGRIVKLVSSAGVETKVTNVNGNVLTVASITGFSNGMTAACWDQDVIEMQNAYELDNAAAFNTDLFLQAPVADAPWCYGQSSGQCPAKLFRVQAIQQSGDLEYKISLLEYNANVYNDSSALIGNYLGAPDQNAQVSSLSVTEQYQFAGRPGGNTAGINTQQSRISVNWIPGPDTFGANVYTSTDDGTFIFQGDSKGQSSFSFYGTAGDSIVIMVVGYDKSGIFAPFSTAPTITIVVQGSALAPANVAGFQMLNATQVQTTGGSSTRKFFNGAGSAPASGQNWVAQVAISNQGSTAVTVDNNYGGTAVVQPGAQVFVNLPLTTNGTTFPQLGFSTANIGDAMNIVVANPFVGQVGGANVFSGTALTFQGWTANAGAAATITQGGVPGSGISPVCIWTAPGTLPDHFEIRYSQFQSQPWPDTTSIAASIPAAATSWVIPTDTIGYYYIVAWNTVARSVNPSSAYWANLPSAVGVGPGGPGNPGGGGPPTPIPIRRPVILPLSAMHDNLSQLAGGISTPLDAQASVLPTVAIALSIITNSNSSGSCTIELGWPATSVPLPDQSSISVPSGNATWTGLAANTTYYCYSYVDIPTATLKFVVAPGTTPDTAPSSAHAAASTQDQRISNGFMTVTTPASSGGSGSGGSGSGSGTSCPDGDELVAVEGLTLRGTCKVKDVRVGERVRGRDLRTGKDVYREVTAITFQPATSWYIIKGHKISPHHFYWHAERQCWEMPYKSKDALKIESGVRVKLTVKLSADEAKLDPDAFYSAHNFILEAKEPGQPELVIHNWIPYS